MQEFDRWAILAELYLELGIVGFIVVCFMGIFVYMILKLLKKLDKIYTVLYDQHSNFLTTQSSFDIIELSLLQSKYGLIEAMMKIYYTNNIHDQHRKTLIRDNLLIIAKNFKSRDLSILSKFTYKTNSLDCYLHSTNYEKFATLIYQNLLSGFSPKDIIVILNNEFNKLISEIQNNIKKSN